LCKGCFVPIAFGIKKANSDVEKQAVEDFVVEIERKDPRRMKPQDYFISCFENKFLLNHSFEPYVIGHLVLQPIEHVTQFHESLGKSPDKIGLSKDDASKLPLIIREVSKLLEECLTAQNYPPARIYMCSFNEAPDWHLHLHLIPRAKQEVIVGPSLLTTVRRQPTKEEVENVVNCLREKLSKSSAPTRNMRAN